MIQEQNVLYPATLQSNVLSNFQVPIPIDQSDPDFFENAESYVGGIRYPKYQFLGIS